MTQKTLISQLSPHLFWDIDINDFDAERNSAQLIQRVLECGELNDWKLVYSFYGLERIVSDCKSLRTLNPKALSFVCAISDTKKEDYRCYNQKHWNY